MSRWIGLAALAMLAGASQAVAQTTVNPHGASVGACTTCHLPNAWRPARIGADFKHAEQTFPLDGAHATAACTTCHTSLEFSKARTQCAACHSDVHRAELGVDCARCHTTRAFSDQARLARVHEATRFPLRGAHSAVACETCHPFTSSGQAQYTGRPTTCIGCHRVAFDRAATPPHVSAGFSTTCITCHTEAAWRGAPFDHNTTNLPLVGAHATVNCATCHADGVFQGKPTTCVSCHRADYDRATNAPPHAAAGFPTTCTTCHTSNTTWKGAPFDHSTTQFPLTGKHLTVSCASCHADGVFKGKPTTCVSCHRQDFDRTIAPAHAAAGFSTSCTTCHTSNTTWKGAPFNHSTTQFPLLGAHLTVSCASCHADGVYRGKPTTCVSCHRADYDRPTNSPPHAAAGYSTTCTTCHTSNTTWRGALFNHSTTQFPLTGAHLTVSCASCHADGVYRGKPTTCVSCHRPDYDRTATPPHSAAGYSTDCATCHTVNSTWHGATFNHSTTQFPLTGAHLTATCASCHADGVYQGKPTACVSCHRPDYDLPTNNPPHAAAGYSTICTTCHTSNTTWRGAVFNHSTTQFPLTGAHLTVSCASCHADGVYRGKPTTCVSCHRPDYDRTTTPSHSAVGYSTDCATCHTVNSTWRNATFNHNTTQFPLAGAHLTATCASCHADGVYRGKPTACVSCHRPDYDLPTNNPPHVAAGFSTDCTTCHTSNTSWAGGLFNHSTTQFPLLGAHLAATCASCHADGVYDGKPTACVSCHQRDYDLPTNNPPHVAAGFSTTCTTCHTTATWRGGSFNHSTTQFPLTGAHLAVTCASCHADGVYRGKPTTCISCHRPDYERSTNTPPHVAAGFSTTCTTCHTSMTTWQGGLFNHSTTQFPLTGAHLTVSCASCHADGVYRGKPTTCVSCHRPDYDQTTTPAHAAAGYSTDCTTCHTNTNSWRGATFNHSTTQFPLTGAHLTATCASCHADGVYRGKPTTCVSCHRSDYDLPTNSPPHAAAGFSTTCTTCHTSTTTWRGGSFNHSTTQFPLTGAHLAVSCASCHADGVYRGKPTTCISCHQRDYDLPTNQPPHAAAGFSTTCTTCHTSMTTWQGGLFNHSTTLFPLTGAHVTASCASCHSNGVYRGKPTACASCHQAAFDATTNPNHRAAFWPNTCASCHTTTRWTGATFDHDGPYFPIYSGAHRGRWASCTTCHTSSSDYRVYTCIGCHQQSTTNSHHTGVSGYRYASTSCYSCHPRGRAG